MFCHVCVQGALLLHNFLLDTFAVFLGLHDAVCSLTNIWVTVAFMLTSEGRTLDCILFKDMRDKESECKYYATLLKILWQKRFETTCYVSSTSQLCTASCWFVMTPHKTHWCSWFECDAIWNRDMFTFAVNYSLLHIIGLQYILIVLLNFMAKFSAKQRFISCSTLQNQCLHKNTGY